MPVPTAFHLSVPAKTMTYTQTRGQGVAGTVHVATHWHTYSARECAAVRSTAAI